MSARPYRPEIEGLRALAVSTVVLHHAGPGFFSGGFVGVSIFFVISGFLITGIIFQELQAGGFSLVKFYERRCRRIIPPLAVMAAVVTALVWLWFTPRDFRDFGLSRAAMAMFRGNLFFSENFESYSWAIDTQPLLHTWSLSVEEQFYIIFPLLMAFLFKAGRARILTLLSIAALGSLAWSAFMIERRPVDVYHLLQYRAWELLLGALLAVAPRRPRLGPGPTTALSLSALGLMLWPAFTYDLNTDFPGLTALPPVGAALFILIHHRGLADSPVGRLMATAPPVALGKISYSLYLWHWPFLALPHYVRGEPPTAWERAGLVALAVMAATISWRLVEQPIRAKRILAGRKHIFAATALALAILTTSGWFIKAINPAADEVDSRTAKSSDFGLWRNRECDLFSCRSNNNEFRVRLAPRPSTDRHLTEVDAPEWPSVCGLDFDGLAAERERSAPGGNQP